ncbi:acyltransferase family protein [Dyella sp.]|uniref:acyltransferase family protein n=1 Tax=Dyella sp. TaxID=1869338 RepID=UPI002ED3F153
MDNLRALAMLAGVIFHAALAYSPMVHGIWPVADRQSSNAIDAIAWWLHMFRMPLFFVVAGFFAAMLVARRGLWNMFRSRLRRILVPLVVGLPIVWSSTYWLTVLAARTVRYPSPMLAWIRRYASNHGSVPFIPGLAHLWFLAYLMLFTILVWVVSTMETGRWHARMKTRKASWLIAWLLPLVLSLALGATSQPFPAPESLLPQLWAVIFFGAYFGLGYHLYLYRAFIDDIKTLAPWLFIAAMVAYVVLHGSWSHADMHDDAIKAALESCVGCWLTLCCLVAGWTWLDISNRLLRWLADASYWVYLVHLPILLGVQYGLLDLEWHWSLKLVVSVLLTLLVCLASYSLLVARTGLRRWVGGGQPSIGKQGRNVLSASPI